MKAATKGSGVGGRRAKAGAADGCGGVLVGGSEGTAGRGGAVEGESYGGERCIGSAQEVDTGGGGRATMLVVVKECGG